MLDCSNKSAEFHHSKEESFKFDRSSISENFLNDDALLVRVNESIAKLESSLRSQSDIDGIYTDWCKILKKQMLKELPVIKRKKIVKLAHLSIALANLGGPINWLTYGHRFVRLKNNGYVVSVEVIN